MAVTTYTLLEGEILSENRNGTERQYVPDPQGNTVALLDTGTAIVKTFSYWSYGELQVGDASATKYRYGGTYGGRSQWDGGIYLRARVVDPEDGSWLTVDPLWPTEFAYVFCNDCPVTVTDPSGRSPFKCERCWYRIGGQYWLSEVHWCCHEFIHCLMCCIINHEFDRECALKMQAGQAADSEKIRRNRLKWCKVGMMGKVETKRCAEHCKANTPPCRKGKNCKVPPQEPYWPGSGVLPPECYNCSPFAKIGLLPFPF